MGLTLQGAVARHLLRHKRPLLVLAVDLYDLLPTLAAAGSGQSRDGLLAADLALQLLLLGLHARGQRSDRILLRDQRPILIGRLQRWRRRWRCNAGCPCGGPGSRGATVVVARLVGQDWRELEDLVGGFSHHALHFGLVQLALAVWDGKPLALRSSAQVAVTVDAVKVSGHRVLVVIVAAVRVQFLFGPLGATEVLWTKHQTIVMTSQLSIL